MLSFNHCGGINIIMPQLSNYFFVPDPDTSVYDVYELFQFYNSYFFQGLLVKCAVRWTKKMTLCAGTCKYEGMGSSTIALSQPLLKFRSNNELKETLIHEMIHAYLFLTNPTGAVRDGGHGLAFQEIMHKINGITGLKITIYHNFKDEVDYYRQHVWRCNGRCRQKAPYYGYVKRATNRKPQPADFWWTEHFRTCGGQFVKISEPSKPNSKQKDNAPQQKKAKKKNKRLKSIEQQSRDHKSWGCGKTIQQYLDEMRNKSAQSSSTRTRQTQFFIGKAKSIEEYSYQIEPKEGKYKQKQKEETIEENRKQEKFVKDA